MDHPRYLSSNQDHSKVKYCIELTDIGRMMDARTHVEQAESLKA